MRRIALAAAVAAIGSFVSQSQAATIGVATGDLVVHFNGTGPEVPSNVSYVTTENTVFNFDQGLAFPFAGYGPMHFFQSVANQFRFDMTFNTPTNTGGAPAPVQAINGNNNGVKTTVSADWAITDPNYGTIGNSPFRGGAGNGSSITFTQTVTPTAGGFHMELVGSLATDGLIHWASAMGSNGNGTSNLNDAFTQIYFPNDGKFYFKGSFDYVTALDTTPGADHYTGRIEFANTAFGGPAVPVPAAAPAGAALLGGLALAKRRRASAAAH